MDFGYSKYDATCQLKFHWNRDAIIRLVSGAQARIYTRKSSEEGLDMEFNSLDAQREACEAYVASRRAQGWVCMCERYDDGGYSGGLKRPEFSGGSYL